MFRVRWLDGPSFITADFSTFEDASSFTESLRSVGLTYSMREVTG